MKYWLKYSSTSHDNKVNSICWGSVYDSTKSCISYQMDLDEWESALVFKAKNELTVLTFYQNCMKCPLADEVFRRATKQTLLWDCFINRCLWMITLFLTQKCHHTPQSELVECFIDVLTTVQFPALHKAQWMPHFKTVCWTWEWLFHSAEL